MKVRKQEPKWVPQWKNITKSVTLQGRHTYTYIQSVGGSHTKVQFTLFGDHIFLSLLVEQERIIFEMKESVEEWDESLKKLSRERERVQLKAHFLRLHLLYLTQRHLVLDSFQLREDEMGEQVRLQQAEASNQ